MGQVTVLVIPWMKNGNFTLHIYQLKKRRKSGNSEFSEAFFVGPLTFMSVKQEEVLRFSTHNSQRLAIALLDKYAEEKRLTTFKPTSKGITLRLGCLLKIPKKLLKTLKHIESYQYAIARKNLEVDQLLKKPEIQEITDFLSVEKLIKG